MYFAQNLIDPNQATEMLANVKHFYSEDGNVAPFLAVDEEGGTVVRIADNDAFGVQDVGDAADLGAAGDATAAKAAAEQIADYLKPLGFNLDYAPVCDVMAVGGGTAMDRRSFGSDPALVADMAKAEIEGFLGKGMLCCAKHFPGIGSAVGDSHEEAITIDKSGEELDQVDLVPFKAAIEAGVGAGDGQTVINDDDNPLANLNGQDTSTERTIADDENPLYSGLAQDVEASGAGMTIGVATGVAVLLAAGVVLWWWTRRRKKEDLAAEDGMNL